MVNSLIKKDVIIIGAGPSGSQLAFRLAKLGYDVLVLDRKTAAGEEVCCTGIISRECIDSFAIDRGLVLRPANSARFVAPSGEWLRLWREDEVAGILDPERDGTGTRRCDHGPARSCKRHDRAESPLFSQGNEAGTAATAAAVSHLQVSVNAWI